MLRVKAKAVARIGALTTHLSKLPINKASLQCSNSANCHLLPPLARTGNTCRTAHRIGLSEKQISKESARFTNPDIDRADPSPVQHRTAKRRTEAKRLQVQWKRISKIRAAPHDRTTKGPGIQQLGFQRPFMERLQLPPTLLLRVHCPWISLQAVHFQTLPRREGRLYMPVMRRLSTAIESPRNLYSSRREASVRKVQDCHQRRGKTH